MCFNQWLLEHNGLGVIASFLVIIIALIPIFREWLHNFKYRKILREQILIELRDIEDSYSGKVNFLKLPTEGRFPLEVPEHDKELFKRLETSFEKSTYLTNEERNKIGLLIRTFRKAIYSKRNGKNVIEQENEYLISDISIQAKDIYELIVNKIK